MKRMPPGGATDATTSLSSQSLDRQTMVCASTPPRKSCLVASGVGISPLIKKRALVVFTKVGSNIAALISITDFCCYNYHLVIRKQKSMMEIRKQNVTIFLSTSGGRRYRNPGSFFLPWQQLAQCTCTLEYKYSHRCVIYFL